MSGAGPLWFSGYPGWQANTERDRLLREMGIALVDSRNQDLFSAVRTPDQLKALASGQ